MLGGGQLIDLSQDILLGISRRSVFDFPPQSHIVLQVRGIVVVNTCSGLLAVGLVTGQSPLLFHGSFLFQLAMIRHIARLTNSPKIEKLATKIGMMSNDCE